MKSAVTGIFRIQFKKKKSLKSEIKLIASVKNYVSDLESMNFIKPILHIFYLGQEERLDKGVDTGLRPVLRLNLLKNQAPSATKKLLTM